MIAWLERQQRFSEKTFGPGPRTRGVVSHIRKELREIEADPHDLKEWIDVVILALDGARRAGFTNEEIEAQMWATLDRNERRRWPDWRSASPDEAIEHIRDEELR